MIYTEQAASCPSGWLAAAYKDGWLAGWLASPKLKQ